MWKAREKKEPCKINVRNAIDEIHVHMWNVYSHACKISFTIYVNFTKCMWNSFFTHVKQFFHSGNFFLHPYEIILLPVCVSFFCINEPIFTHVPWTFWSCMRNSLQMWNNFVMLGIFFPYMRYSWRGPLVCMASQIHTGVLDFKTAKLHTTSVSTRYRLWILYCMLNPSHNKSW